ncbi:MAG: hypothetical protein WDM90_18715 [Ferruginibacter sp.]
MDNFYINRLKTFSIAEFPYRIKQLVVKKLEENVYKAKPSVPLQLMPVKSILQPSFDNVKPIGDTANIFGKPFNFNNIQPADWHRDIFSGKSFPLSFAKNIGIRKDHDLSAKVVWEINGYNFWCQ